MEYKKFKSNLDINMHRFAGYLIASLILLVPAFYNGYPLVNPDTGGNIDTAFNFHVPIERPISYSVLLRLATTLIHSLWMIVLLQSFILVYIIDRVSKKLLGNLYNQRIFFLIIITLSFFTSCSWHTSHILPDIFTAASILLILDFLLHPNLTRQKKWLYFFSIWVLLEQHNSNLLIALLISIALCIYCRLHRNSELLKKSFFLLALTLFSFISISFFNLWEGNSFRPSASTQVFMMARMAENGVLDEFLEEYCPTEHYSICAYQGNTGDRQWDFMWVKGHLIDNGGHDHGWFATEKEYKRIVFKSLTTPKYLFKHMYESVEGTLRQLVQISVGIMIEGPGSSPYVNVEKYFPYEIKEYRTALEPQAVLNKQMSFFNAIIYLFFIGSIMATIRCFSSKSITQRHKNIFKFIIFSVLCNAFVTSTFSTVVDRLQSRVSWLIPYMCVILVILACSNTRYTIFQKPDKQ